MPLRALSQCLSISTHACVQNDHEAFRAEANKRSAASQEECSELRGKVDAANRDIQSLQKELQRLEDSNREASAAQIADTAKAAVGLPFFLIKRHLKN